MTFHRAFDDVLDQARALESLVGAGVSRVLTSGGAATAIEGAASLGALVRAARDRIIIMAGGTVRANNVSQLVATSGVREVHARCGPGESRIRALRDAMGR